MLVNAIDVLTHFPVRKSRSQKRVFLDAVQAYAQARGYACNVEKGNFGCRNLVMGDPEKAKYLVTAHYDTCAWLPFPNLITPCNFISFLAYQLFLVIVIMAVSISFGLLVGFVTGNQELSGIAGYLCVWVLLLLMLVGPANRNNANDNTSGVVTVLEILRSLPDNQREKVCFVLFDLEEAGLIGSAAYRKAHRNATEHQIVLNLDCVGDGDHILFFPTQKLKKDRKKLTSLYKCCGYFGNKSVTVREKGFSVYPSDQTNFPYGVGICALRASKFGLYLGRIHTNKDTVLEETNVNILRAGLITLISSDAG